ncbi:DUF3093 domain-containing protein [Planosporangium flavigriseum]|uniref:DUF3093 domain-containing protein n=1 Tax=Planosporangium flavigriseum TaxID=373681 RepID=A0A8J3LQ97_9ACTN|nr:DUF3093 domain-containing protein [Planosporangium flavigriseum]NJC63955.1 DUF3093 domain-containing protein [Planosporangium flavigriseum]GIG74668.1 hypothetical protein Pfl04_30720 [Planosporangium flavigriseum]
MPQQAAAQTGNEAPIRHVERLRVPWWLWPPALAFTALLAAELHLGAPGLRAWVPYAILLPATAAGLWALGRLRVAVADGELRVDDARLPVRYVAGVTVLGVAEKRTLLGVAAHPYAFVVQRPWIKGAVQVHLNDPNDPTPYWVVSSRRPAALAASLLAARASADSAPAE